MPLHPIPNRPPLHGLLSEPSDRRNFLHSLGGGFGAAAGLALLHQDLAFAAPPRRGIGDVDPLCPMAARQPHFAPTAKSVIFLFLVGGPSQIDTWDYKPELQKLDGQKVPASIREALNKSVHSNVFHGCEDKILASPYAFKQYGESGIWRMSPSTFTPCTGSTTKTNGLRALGASVSWPEGS